MQFHNSTISPPSVIEPGSCQAVRVCSALEVAGTKQPLGVDVAENAAKQRAYEQQRAEWRQLCGIKNTF